LHLMWLIYVKRSNPK